MTMELVGPVYLVGGQDFNRVHLDWEANDANVYLVDTRDTFVLIDCGCGDSLPGILEIISRMEVDVGEISHLLLTHAHFPHAAAADAVQKMNVEVMASAETAEAVCAGDLRTAAFCYHHEFPPCEGEVGVLEEGVELEIGAVRLRVLALPGHSPGCLGYELEAEGHRMLFCGDVVRSPRLRERTDRFGFDPEARRQSLQRLLEDPPEILYPGHGPFCLSHADVWIEEELRKVLEESH